MKTIVYANIYTANPQMPQATAMMVEDGYITWIGKREEITATDAVIIDESARYIVPGFIEAHMHPILLAQLVGKVVCLPPAVSSIAEIIAALRAYEPKNGWYEGWGFDEGKTVDKRMLTRADLDAVSTEKPVVVIRSCTHLISVNSKALEIAGITRDTANPEGGEIDRDAHGEPTGILRENARHLVLQYMPVDSEAETVDKLLELSKTLASYGVTSLTEMMATHEPFDHLTLLQKAAEKGFAQQVALYYLWQESASKTNILAAENLCTDAQMFVAGIKLFADGSVSGKTAYVYEPFLQSDETGIVTTTPTVIQQAVDVARQKGIQLAVHAMGDRAIDLVVDSVVDNEHWLGDVPAIRIEHATMPSEKALALAATHQIGFVPQPIFLFSEVESYVDNLGIEKTQQLYAVKSFLAHQIPTALSSDAPATSWAEAANPFVTMHAAVNRVSYDGVDLGQQQRITVKEAVDLYTREAQRLTRIAQVGQLKEGYRADYVVLADDIFTMPTEVLLHVKPLATYKDGVCIYTRE